jgi:hypothetical protein
MMDQDQRLDAIIERIGRVEALREIPVPPELARPKSFLKVLSATHRNWESKRFRKIFGMRFSVRIPPLEQINSIFYPQENYDIPVFIFFCLITRRKVIAHLNLNCVFDDEQYRQRWVAPLVEILNGYQSFDSNDRYPEWMKKYRNEATIYGLFPRDRLEDLSNCCFEYLDYYADQVAQSEVVSAPEKLDQIRQFQGQWVEDIRTQDKAQGMIAKMIGKQTARRIFYEVTT